VAGWQTRQMRAANRRGRIDPASALQALDQSLDGANIGLQHPVILGQAGRSNWLAVQDLGSQLSLFLLPQRRTAPCAGQRPPGIGKAGRRAVALAGRAPHGRFAIKDESAPRLRSRPSRLGIGRPRVKLYRICRFCGRGLLARYRVSALPGSTFSITNFARGLPMAFFALRRCCT